MTAKKHNILILPDAVGDSLNASRAYQVPARQKPASFNLDGVLQDLENAGGGGNH